jgi:hypothetical protein
MGGYITNSELAIRYPLVNRWVGAGSATIVNSYLIYYAEAEIDGLLSPEFTTPYSSGNVPPIVKDLTLELCKVRIVADQDVDLSIKLRNAVVDRVKELKDNGILGANGEITMPGGPGAEIWSSTMNYHSTHSMLDAESEFTRVSSEMLYDLENERI